MTSTALRKPIILFICTGNAGRSQMAEALFRHGWGDQFEVCSGGVEPWPALHPIPVKLMTEEGVSLAGHFPKHVREFRDAKIDLAVTIGDRAEAETGAFRTGTLRLHWPIKDPADADGTPDAEKVFRYTRQAIKDRLPELARIAGTLTGTPDLALRPALATSALRPHGFDHEAADCLPAFRPREHLPLVKKAGFDAAEVTCYAGALGELDFPWRAPGAVKELRQIAGDLGVAIASAHAPELRLSAKDPGKGEKLDVLRQFVDVCMELEARLLVTHFWPEADDDHAAAIPPILQELDALVQHQPLLVGLETLQSAALNRGLVGMLGRLNHSSFGAVIDSGHSHMAGDVYTIAAAFGRRLKGLHLHDNDGTGDEHAPLGRGTLDWQRFGDSLRAAGYEGPLTLEVDARPAAAELPVFLRTARQSLSRLGSF